MINGIATSPLKNVAVKGSVLFTPSLYVINPIPQPKAAKKDKPIHKAKAVIFQKKKKQFVKKCFEIANIRFLKLRLSFERCHLNCYQLLKYHDHEELQNHCFLKL